MDFTAVLEDSMNEIKALPACPVETTLLLISDR